MSVASSETIQVLHVDDDAEFADLTGTLLEREKDRFAVQTTTSADEALQCIGDCPPDCLVSDYNMPGLDGIEFLEAVRRESPDLPFILFTGKGSEEVASEALRAGATDYIQKQSGTEQYELLANRIDNAVTQYRSAQRLRETREEYTAVFENAQNALMLIEVENDGFRYRRCNPRAVELIGRDRADIVGHTPHEALGPENGSKVVGAYRACIERRDPVAYTVTLDLPVGEVVRECEVTPVSLDGEISQLVVEFRDVTEQRERQRELRSERWFIDQALDALDDLFYVLDTDGRLRRWNSRVPDITGYTESELEDMQVVELFLEDARERVTDATRMATLGQRVTVEADLLTADGERVPYEFTGARLTDADGNTTGIVGIGRDLTERRWRERRFQALVEGSDDIISILSPDGVFEYQSPSVERILGYDPEEAIGDTAWEYVHPDDRDTVIDTFEQWTTRPEATGAVEYRARHADGSWRWMEARVSNQFDTPAVEGYVVNSRDVTDRRKRQAELQEVKDQYQTLVKNFPDGAVFLFDTDFEYVRVGGQELTAVGLSPEDVIGATPHDLFPEGIVDETVHYYRETLDGASHTFEQEYGGERYRIQTTPVRADDGEIAYGLAVSQNITAEAERRRELERQREQLDEFASIVSHDLQSPLAVAEGNLELAQETYESDRLARAAAAIDRSQALIDDLLTLAREGQTVAEVEPVELADVIERSWQTVETERGTLETDVSSVIHADESRLQQLFENLCRNAIDHGREDVTVFVGVVDDGFYVADTGPGIPASEREAVFEAGYSTNEDGTGFGLRIVEEVAEAHGWEIAVTESEQGGARFEITGVESADR